MINTALVVGILLIALGMYLRENDKVADLMFCLISSGTCLMVIEVTNIIQLHGTQHGRDIALIVLYAMTAGVALPGMAVICVVDDHNGWPTTCVALALWAFPQVALVNALPAVLGAPGVFMWGCDVIVGAMLATTFRAAPQEHAQPTPVPLRPARRES